MKLLLLLFTFILSAFSQVPLYGEHQLKRIQPDTILYIEGDLFTQSDYIDGVLTTRDFIDSTNVLKSIGKSKPWYSLYSNRCWISNELKYQERSSYPSIINSGSFIKVVHNNNGLLTLEGVEYTGKKFAVTIECDQETLDISSMEKALGFKIIFLTKNPMQSYNSIIENYYPIYMH
ncbi:MAG: hypothetical protein N4A33_00630 [Bacteriovoracaceae bacterium]|jgi:hypothetical protein|nr:hypothetical protein [Bacteriovoracaceae bacterium]